MVFLKRVKSIETRGQRSHGGLNPPEVVLISLPFVLDRLLTGPIFWKIQGKDDSGEKGKFWDFGIAGSLSVLLLETPIGSAGHGLGQVALVLDSSKGPEKTE